MYETLEQLVDACRNGDRDAQAELVRRFHPWATNFAASLVDDTTVTADVVQEAFACLIEGLNRLRDSSALPGFLRQILRRCAFRQNRIGLDACVVDLSDAPSSGRSPFDEVARRETADVIQSAVGALPSKTRVAVELFYLAELPCAEISQCLGVPVGTVKRRLHDGRKRLRHSLIGLFGTEKA